MKICGSYQHLWSTDCSLGKWDVVYENKCLPVNHLCLCPRSIAYFMHAFKGFRVSSFDTWWWWTVSKYLPKRFLNWRRSIEQPFERQGCHPGEGCGTRGWNPPSGAFRTINHDGLIQTRNSQPQALCIPLPVGKLVFQKPKCIVPIGKALVLNSKKKKKGGGSKMTLQRQLKELDKAAWIKNSIDIYILLAQMWKIRFLLLNFGIERWVTSKVQLELKFKFSCLRFTLKEAEISEKRRIIYLPMESST